MRRQAFVLTMVFLFVLLILMFILPPKNIISKEELSDYQPNQRFIVQGQVIKETISKYYKNLYLNNSLILQCDSPCPSFINQNITSSAILERYDNKEYLKVLRIKKT